MAPQVFLLLLLLSPLFFALIIPTSSTETTFHFSGNITCRHDYPFTYQIQVIEKDFALPDDTLSSSSFVYNQTSPAPYYIRAYDTGDGPFDPTYEIKFWVYHDCGHGDRTHKWAVIQVANFPVKDGNIYYTFDFDITDKGKVYEW